MLNSSATTKLLPIIDSERNENVESNADLAGSRVVTSVIGERIDQWRSTSATATWEDDPVAERARRAGLLVVAQLQPEEIEAIHRERAQLAFRAASGQASLSERRRLTLLEWEIDRIDDFHFGGQMDKYKLIAEETRRLGEHIQTITERVAKLR